MFRLLLTPSAFSRIEVPLKSIGLPVEPVLMSPEGLLSVAGKPVTAADSGASVAWLSDDVLLGGQEKPFIDAILKSPSMKWVHSGAAGYDAPIFADIVRRGIRLTRNDAQRVAIAEYVVGAVLGHFQRATERRTEQTAKRWTRLPFREVAGSKWLVVGFGPIGQEIARRARAFDAYVTGVRRAPGSHDAANALVTLAQSKTALAEADVVVLALRLSQSTSGIVDKEFLAAMKPGSVLVNIGRGGLVDETALLDSLDAGKPEAAILDVFEKEPLDAEHPFWAHPRVTITAHYAGHGSGLRARGDALFLENLRLFLRGEPLRYEVRPADVLGKSDEEGG